MSTEFFSTSTRIEHVQRQILRLHRKTRKGARFTMISCPYHNDDTPSGQIKHDPARPRSVGFYVCRGCGTTRNWNEFAADQGLEPFFMPDEMDVPSGLTSSYDEQLLGEDDGTPRENIRFSPLDEKALPLLGLDKPEWRGFSFDWLRSTMNAKTAEVIYDSGGSSFWVYIPVMVRGREVGHVKARPRKDTSEKKLPSYLNAPGEWSRTHGLFGYDQAATMLNINDWSTFVLVEGPRDALRLLRDGIPAIAILGTHSWTTSKIRRLELLSARNCVLCMDGDAAGKKASSLLFSGYSVSPLGVRSQQAVPLRESFITSSFDLTQYATEDDPEPDPCSVSDEAIQHLKEVIT